MIPVKNKVLTESQIQCTSELRHAINKFTGTESTFCLDFLRLQIINIVSDERTGDKNIDEVLLNQLSKIRSILLGDKFLFSSRPISQKYFFEYI